MENQHRKITGYRELSQDEIDLMNEIKALGSQLQTLCEKVEEHVHEQFRKTALCTDDETSLSEQSRLDAADPFHWADRGERTLQEGLMFLTRAVGQPTSF